MNLCRLPCDESVVVDLDRVSYLETAEVGESGSVLFPGPDVAVEVNIHVGWSIFLGIDGQEFPWSGTCHASRDAAGPELEEVAEAVGWSKMPTSEAMPWVRRRVRFR